jgi:steroid 5-alpha reductase family enzyme
MWVLIAIAIEGMALIGALSVLITRRTLVAFVAGFNTMALVTAIYALHGGLCARSVLVMAMVAIYLLRINWVLIFWTEQTALGKLDDQNPALQKILLPVVLANTTGWLYCLPFYFATRNPDPLGGNDVLALVIYLVGTALHFGADYQKRRFKSRADAKGKLLDSGLWALCRHPNYFGDFLIYVSFAAVGASLWGWIAPLMNVLQYAFDAIPKNEKWAAERYGPAWEAYRAKTKAFIPYLV